MLVQDRFAVALGGTDTLVGLILLQERPVGTISERDTLAVSPFRLLTVIVEVADTPRLAVAEEAMTVKSE